MMGTQRLLRFHGRNEDAYWKIPGAINYRESIHRFFFEITKPPNLDGAIFRGPFRSVTTSFIQKTLYSDHHACNLSILARSLPA